MTHITGTNYAFFIRPNIFSVFTPEDVRINVYDTALPEIGTICKKVAVRGMRFNPSYRHLVDEVYGDAECPNGVIPDWKK